ncbi:MAG: hypothetical protein P1P84_05240 [Deferrisomatales bacterium]|nr:hypothetical protein [Deferrisomatales bacterium]
MHPLWRHLSTSVLALALLTARAPASSVPEPLFAADPDGFADRVGRGQFSELLEVHRTQYAADPAWAAAWAAGRYQRSGLLAAYGSISSRQLLQNLDLALNLRPSAPLQLRYDQRRWADTLFDLREERFDLLWWPTPGCGLMASGWPTPQKQSAAVGFGGSLGPAGGRNQLAVLVRDDRYAFNQKTDSGVHFTRHPLRLLIDGSTSGGAWRTYGSLNLGTSYAAEDRPEGSVIRATAGRLQHGHAGALWRRGPVHATLTSHFISQERVEDDAGARARSLERDWWRVDGTLEFAPGAWGGALLGGYAWQRDRFFAAGDVDGGYRARNTLGGTEGIYRHGKALELRLGYVGNVFRMQRDSAVLGLEPPTLADHRERGYVDKAHLRGRYRFGPSLVLELLISKEVSRGSFGGFSVRAFGQL